MGKRTSKHANQVQGTDAPKRGGGLAAGGLAVGSPEGANTHPGSEISSSNQLEKSSQEGGAHRRP